ncbi:MAG: sugar phosphate isomerase/epimerase [Xanthomonadales bacterium]|nr:sugar phosphate isomerase/epimerase [Xanthomonadales bacterium]
MQKLHVFQSLWAMELRRPGQPERPMEENFALAAEAGYHGLCVDPSVEEIPATLDLLPLFGKHGLKCMVNAFPHSREEMRPLLEMAREMNACHVNALGTEIPLSVSEGAATVQQWLEEAAAVGIPLLFETHRDSLLNDLGYTLQLLDAVPEMRLCADLSHFVVDRELRLPLSDLNRGYINRVLQRSDCFQGRVASSEQIQVQIDFPQHQCWVEQFKTWWADGISWWRERNGDDATLVFLCELGPPIYAITDAQGLELSDRWEEAKTIRQWVESIWSCVP